MFETLFSTPSPIYYLFYYFFYTIYYLLAWLIYTIFALFSIARGLLSYSFSIIFFVTFLRMIYLAVIAVHKLCQWLSQKQQQEKTGSNNGRPTNFPSPLSYSSSPPLPSSPPPFSPQKPDVPIFVRESSNNVVFVREEESEHVVFVRDESEQESVDSSDIQYQRGLSDFDSEYEVRQKDTKYHEASLSFNSI